MFWKTDDVEIVLQKLGYSIIVHTESFQLKLKCAPRRSNGMINLQFQNTVVVHPSASEVVNANLSALSLRRKRHFSPATAYPRIVRLLELNVPTIDAMLHKSNALLTVSNVNLKVSSEKIEEITLFYDI